MTTLDLSYNSVLSYINCSNNELTSLDVDFALALDSLFCNNNRLTSLDVTQNTALTHLWCYQNQLTALDVSQNPFLVRLDTEENQLNCLNLKNGNNTILNELWTFDNSNLECILADDSTYSNTNWINNPDFHLDSNQYFSENCNYPLGCFNINPNSVQEIPQSISLYPNPTNENITISIENFTGNLQTEVYDLIGNRLQSTNETTISLQDYPSGIYSLKVAYGDRVEEVKVIKE